MRIMFVEKTALVLGAGASAPYNFPSGEGLVNDVINGLKSGSGLFGCVRQMYDRALWMEFSERLRPCMSADVFLEKKENERFLDVGKACIAAALLPRENEDGLFGKPTNGRSWYKQLFDFMTEGTQSIDGFQANTLSVITFNYDRSLEYYLVTALHDLYSGKTIEQCYEKVRAVKVIHVYGKLGRLPWEEQDGTVHASHVSMPIPYGEQALRETQQDTLFAQKPVLIAAAGNIQIISEGMDDTERFEEARRLLGESSKVFILGFGFHPTNLKRLKLELLTRHQLKCTTHELGADRRKSLDRYPGLTRPVDSGFPHRSQFGWFDGRIDEFIQKVGLT
jgi:hypothetical protein